MDKLIVEFSNYFETDKVDDYTSAILNSKGEPLLYAVVPERMNHIVTFRCISCKQLSTSYLELITDRRHQRNVITQNEKGNALLSFVTYELECDKCSAENTVIYDVQVVASTTRGSATIVGSRPGDEVTR